MRHACHFALLGTLVTGCVEAEGIPIGPDGGVLESEDGRLRVELRDGALEEVLSIAIVDSDECPAAAKMFGCWAFEPYGVQLLYPATVVYEYEQDHLPPNATARGVSPNSLQMLVQDEHGWSPGHDAEVDAARGDLWASVLQLTAIAIVGRQ